MFLSVDVGTFFLMLFAAGFVLALIALPIFGLFHLYKWAAKKGYWKTGLAVVVAIVGYAAYSMYTGIYPTDDFYLSEFELVTLREAPKSAIRSIQVPMSPWRDRCSPRTVHTCMDRSRRTDRATATFAAWPCA
jgi:hypothetical protein